MSMAPHDLGTDRILPWLYWLYVTDADGRSGLPPPPEDEDAAGAVAAAGLWLLGVLGGVGRLESTEDWERSSPDGGERARAEDDGAAASDGGVGAAISGADPVDFLCSGVVSSNIFSDSLALANLQYASTAVVLRVLL